MRTEGSWFIDAQGRRLLLRGVNLSGSSKVPYAPDGATYRRDHFFNHRDISFVGRPFPLDEADEHFSRLKHWGLTTLRFLITWEAIEHAGPGIYDEAYLDYLERVVAKAGDYGFRLFIDPHQDVWSRFSGGDGAPGWTLEAAGFNLEHLHPTGAAFVHAMVGEDYPRMIWSTNDSKLASATMFTLFFAGNVFAPNTHVSGQPIQDFLQSHYFQAVQEVAKRLQRMPHVMGYDSLNEPSDGWIGWQNLQHHEGVLQLGETPTPFQGMQLGDGLPTEVDVYAIRRLGIRKIGARLLNPEGVRAWQDDRVGVWREHGVWQYQNGKPVLSRPDYFASVNGRTVDFSNDFLKPFINQYGRTIRQVDPPALIFIEGVPTRGLPNWTEDDLVGIVDSSHWYDALTLLTKRWISFLSIDVDTRRLILGARKVLASFRQALRTMKEQTRKKLGAVPTLIGEFGIPFDLQKKRSYRTGRFDQQIKALDASFQAIEANLLHATLWNYTPDNTNAHGDLWNDEDLSIFSRDQQDKPEDINSGARAPEAFIRPYPVATSGEPRSLSFDPHQARFSFSFESDPQLTVPTEIYVPEFHYGKGVRVEVSDGSYDLDLGEQRLIYHPATNEGLHWIRLTRP